MQVPTDVVTDAPRTMSDLLVEQQLIETAQSRDPPSPSHLRTFRASGSKVFLHSSDWFKNI